MVKHMLEKYACGILSAKEPRESYRYASLAAEVCILRYPYCKPTLLEYVNRQLQELEITPINDFHGVADLVEKIQEKILSEGEGRLYTRRDTREVKRLGELATHLFTVAVIATLDALGVRC